MLSQSRAEIGRCMINSTELRVTRKASPDQERIRKTHGIADLAVQRGPVYVVVVVILGLPNSRKDLGMCQGTCAFQQR